MIQKLTLRTKILLLIVLLNIGLILSTLFIVNYIAIREANKTLQNDLQRTQVLFETYLKLKDKETSVENRLIGEIPFLKALISSKEKMTILDYVKTTQEQIKSDLLFITDEKGYLLASTDSKIANGAQEISSVQKAVRGIETDAFLVGEQALYQITTSPIWVGQTTIGTITNGFRVDNKLADEIKRMTQSEVTFINGETVIASTWKENTQESMKNLIGGLTDKIAAVLARHETSPSFDMKVGNENFLSVLLPISKQNSGKGIFLIQRSRDEVAHFLIAIRNTVFLAGVIILLLAVWMGYLVANQIAKPLTDIIAVSKLMAGGDLSTSVTVKNQDEIGMLALAFNEMAVRLRELIRHVHANTLSVSQISSRLHETSDSISSEVQSQKKAVEETSSSILQMSVSIRSINKNVEILSNSTNDTSSSVLQMEASSTEIANHMGKLSSTMDTTTSSISQLSSSVKEIGKSIETLDQITENTATSLHELNSSVQQVEKNAGKSHELWEKTAMEAQRGMTSIHETITGMREIKTSFMDLQEIVSRLSEKSDSIGKIIKVIADVAKQTNLLSLNAAIIAAQAGDHGKGFTVVAEEIKNLAGRTAISTQEIAVLIKDVQDETANAVNAMVHGSVRVNKGVVLSDEAENVLKGIIESSHSSTDMVSQIVRATREQAIGIQEVDRAMLKIKEMVQQINKTTQEQGKSSDEIIKATGKLRDLGSEVKRATEEQSRGSKLITISVEKIIGMTTQIHGATKEQDQGSQRIHQAVETFKNIAIANVDRVNDMNHIVANLSEQSSELQKEIGKFKA